MTYVELKRQIENLKLTQHIDRFEGFEESFDFEYFQTFFAMANAPKYTLLQFKDSEEFNTSNKTWALCLPKEGQMYVIDMGTEDEICDQFFNLIELMRYGFGTAEIRQKQ